MSSDDIKHKARLLRQTSFDPTKVAKESPEEQLRALDQEARNEKAFDEAAECADCQRARRDSGDATTLCRDHLAKAMGF